MIQPSTNEERIVIAAYRVVPMPPNRNSFGALRSCLAMSWRPLPRSATSCVVIGSLDMSYSRVWGSWQLRESISAGQVDARSSTAVDVKFPQVGKRAKAMGPRRT